jgi:acylpyruvate hydrolase
MRLVSYLKDGAAGVGVLEGDLVIPREGIEWIGDGVGTAEILAAPRSEDRACTLADVHLLPVSPRPKKIFCVGLNYLAHVEETRRDLPTYPVLFTKFASNLIGAHDPIRLPAESMQVDYEGELAVIIGLAGRRIPEEDAIGHVLGYTIANDVTMRNYQYRTHQWVQGKAWDSSTPLGPSLVTADSVDLTRAGIRTVVNGETVQDSDLSRLIFAVPQLISVVSEFTALEPGDVILTGTPGGVGFRRDPQLFLRPGDVVTVEIDGVGTLTSDVVAE